jgi:hypothetical protein
MILGPLLGPGWETPMTTLLCEAPNCLTPANTILVYGCLNQHTNDQILCDAHHKYWEKHRLRCWRCDQCAQPIAEHTTRPIPEHSAPWTPQLKTRPTQIAKNIELQAKLTATRGQHPYPINTPPRNTLKQMKKQP